jgi:hypothetical protein
MRKSMKTFVAAAAFVASGAMASALYADNSESKKVHEGATIGSGMMGTTNMMEEMSGMMNHCNQMMQGMTADGTGKPNEQWRKEAPVVPDQSD